MGGPGWPARVSLMDAWTKAYPELPGWVAERRAEGVGAKRLQRRLLTDFDIRIAVRLAQNWLEQAGPSMVRPPARPSKERALPPGDPRHGINGYTNYKCRCPTCRLDWSTAAVDYRKINRTDYKAQRDEAQGLADLLARAVKEDALRDAALSAWEARSWA